MNKHTTIFIIENSTEISEAVKKTLENFQGHEILVHTFKSVSEAIENKLFQPEIIFINYSVYSKVSSRLLDSLELLIKGIHIVTISGKKETNQFTKALRSGVEYYIPNDNKYLDKVNKYMHCYFTDTIPNKTILLKQWYFELDREAN